MGGDGPSVRRIWTREGLIGVKQPSDSLGATKEERLEAMIVKYADEQVSGLRGPMRNAYLRAYRRAGLLSGSADEDCHPLPPEPESAPKASKVADSMADTCGASKNGQRPTEGHLGANVNDDEER